MPIDIKRISVFLLLCSPYLLLLLVLISLSTRHDYSLNEYTVDQAIEKNRVSEIIKILKSDKCLESKIHSTQILSKAVRKAKFQIIKGLLENGVDPNLREYEEDVPIIQQASGEACYAKDTENRMKIVQLLIDFGADVNYRDGSGASAIQWAARCGNIKLADLLTVNGANVNFKSSHNNRTPLIEAVIQHNNTDFDPEIRKQYLAMVKHLIDAGANPYARVNDESWGISALDWAKQNNDHELIEILATSQNSSSLITYNEQIKLTTNAKNLDKRMKAFGLRLNPQIYVFITKLPLLWLFLPSMLTGLYGARKNDSFFLKSSIMMFTLSILSITIFIAWFLISFLTSNSS